MMHSKPLLILCIIIVFNMSCRRDNQNEKTSVNDTETGFSQVEEQIKNVYYRFPSPGEMFNYVQHENLSFDQSILIPTYHAEKLIDSRKQKVNLGLYMSDLAYITVFGRYKESTEYLKIIHQLSEDIRVDGAFDKAFISRIEQNLKNVDSLSVISNEALEKLINYLTVNDMESTFAIIAMGGFIETIYISTQMVENFDPDNQTVRRIADQKFTIRNLMEYVNEYRSNPDVAETLEEISPVIEVLNSLKVINNETNVKNSVGKIKLSGGNKVVITKNEYLKIKRTIEEVRNILLN